MTTPIDALAAQGWTRRDDGKAVEKTFRFSHFRDAIAFMVTVSFEADRLDHHPEWFNVYDRVEVTLTTHDADGVTDKDVVLGTYMDDVATR